MNDFKMCFECNSGSIYESPVSTFNDSRTSSPSYATPMDRSPWASPQASNKGHSPTGSIRSPTGSIRSPPLLSPPFLRVKSPPSDTSLRRCSSVKTNTGNGSLTTATSNTGNGSLTTTANNINNGSLTHSSSNKEEKIAAPCRG